jgi:hypothetical protein
MTKELKLDLNRYNGGSFLERIQRENFAVRGDEAFITLTVAGDDEIEVCIPAENGEVASQFIGLAVEVLENLSDFDNQVQRSCANECKSTGLHPRNYESVLAYIRLKPNTAILHYWGAAVNTEWDEKFSKKLRGHWEHVGSGGQF